MTFDKKKFLNLLKAIDTMNIVLMLFLAFIHPFIPVYDEAGNLNETHAIWRIAIILMVLFVAVPIFRKEIKAILDNKKPYRVTKKHNTVFLPKLNYYIAIIFAIAPIVFIPLSIYRYRTQGLEWQLFYAVFYLFVYVGIGSRLQLKMALKHQ